MAAPFLIGYWKASLNDEYPFAQEVEASLAPDTRDAIAAYLEAGARFEQYRGYSHCRYGCHGQNGSAELWDGTWVWPDGLAHYIREHRVSLPPEFLAHVAGPKNRGVSLARVPDGTHEVDRSLWIRWGAAHRSAQIGRALDEARTLVATRVLGLRRLAAQELAAAEGLADSVCLTAGCAERALSGRALCALCLVGDGPLAGAWEAEAIELRRITALVSQSSA